MCIHPMIILVNKKWIPLGHDVGHGISSPCSQKKTPRFEEIPMTYGFTAVKDGVIVVFTHDL